MQSHRLLRAASRTLVVTVFAIFAGCATQGPRAGAIATPPPQLQLVAQGRLELPTDCTWRRGAVYRTSYVVQGDGRVTDVRPGPAPTCLQAAFNEWVQGFRYTPPGTTVPTTIEWMGVAASRGR